MKITLMSSVPCKRFDFSPMCEDGRGGWTFSQFGADRYVARPANHGVKLGLSIWVTPAIHNDYVEATELVASSDAAVLGKNVLEWKRPNDAGSHHAAGSVYQWIQDIEVPLRTDTLVRIGIRVKLKSQRAFFNVAGAPLVHVTLKNTNDKLVSPDEYSKSLDDEKRSYSW